MSIMDSDGLSTSEIMGDLSEAIDDRGVLGQWMKQPRQFGSNSVELMLCKHFLAPSFRTKTALLTENPPIICK
ncbi:hypothetical protein Y032_0019g3895 [Ancylostoma ceylanicum]|uniref:Uncharacterized protein n=1 Tax=Ancylostoma ceylanicum TaxID=53326 RepID=A0A016V1P7_9BILA|nr:hypothetical protein Y032_0019g3895 [Ancylostoma ceylanicum]